MSALKLTAIAILNCLLDESKFFTSSLLRSAVKLLSLFELLKPSILLVSESILQASESILLPSESRNVIKKIQVSSSLKIASLYFLPSC